MASPSNKKVKRHHVSSTSSQFARPLQSPLALFLNLPRELRDMIYRYCDLDWNVINNAMAAFEDYMSDFASERNPYCYESARKLLRSKVLGDEILPSRSTPNVLRICRQITDEALEVLRSKPLALGPPIALVARNHWPLRITAFISAPTLQHVRHLVFTPDARGRAWCDPSDRLHSAFNTSDEIDLHLYDPSLDFTRSPFVELESRELHEYLWGIRNALRDKTALKTLTIRFGIEHGFEARKMYYEQVLKQLAMHIPLLDVTLPEPNEVAEDVICDLLTSTGSILSGRFEDSGWDGAW